MSTRALYSFLDENKVAYHVYKHSDGYPTGALDAIDAAMPFAWRLPRFEADDFAAAFVAANKTYQLESLHREFFRRWQNNNVDGWERKKESIEAEIPPAGELSYSGGGVRLLPNGAGKSWKSVAPYDIEYRYEVYEQGGQIFVRGFSVDYIETALYPSGAWKQKKLFALPVIEAMAWAKAEAEKESA